MIRFEPHIVCRRTGDIYNTLHGDCSFTPRMGYPTSVDQSWTLFRTAASLNPKAAVMATSWGHSTLLILIITICFMPFLFLFDEFNFSRELETHSEIIPTVPKQIKKHRVVIITANPFLQTKDRPLRDRVDVDKTYLCQVGFHEHIDRLLRSCSNFGDE